MGAGRSQSSGLLATRSTLCTKACALIKHDGNPTRTTRSNLSLVHITRRFPKRNSASAWRVCHIWHTRARSTSRTPSLLWNGGKSVSRLSFDAGCGLMQGVADDGAGERSGLPRGEDKGNLRQIFFGRSVRLLFSPRLCAKLLLQIVEGTARTLVHTFDVKKRAYFGNTSMEAEISLLMANQSLVSFHESFTQIVNSFIVVTGQVHLRPLCGNGQHALCALLYFLSSVGISHVSFIDYRTLWRHGIWF